MLLAHLVAVIGWFGSAAADVLLELMLRTETSPDARDALIRLHRRLDLSLEGPGIVLAVSTGVVLLVQRGWMHPDTQWPRWLVVKVIGAAVAAAANLACIAFVVARAGAARRSDDVAVRKWSRAIFVTGAAIPFALAALALAVLRPQ